MVPTLWKGGHRMIRKLVALSLLIFALGVAVSKPTSAAIPCSCEFCPSNTVCTDSTNTVYWCTDYVRRFCLET